MSNPLSHMSFDEFMNMLIHGMECAEGAGGTEDAPPEPTERDQPLTVTIEREGEKTYRSTTDAAFLCFMNEEGDPVMRVLGDRADLGVACSMLLYVVVKEFGVETLDDFIDRSVNLAAQLYADDYFSG